MYADSPTTPSFCQRCSPYDTGPLRAHARQRHSLPLHLWWSPTLSQRRLHPCLRLRSGFDGVRAGRRGQPERPDQPLETTVDCDFRATGLSEPSAIGDYCLVRGQLSGFGRRAFSAPVGGSRICPGRRPPGRLRSGHGWGHRGDTTVSPWPDCEGRPEMAVKHAHWQCPRCGTIMFWFGAASHVNRCRGGEGASVSCPVKRR